MMYLIFALAVQICAQPRVSIITSVYKADIFISHFFEDITRQTIFHECELILVNAASPGQEERVIESYLQQYPNIKYFKFEQDPGLYAVWNFAISMASAPYITNANVDDRHARNFLSIMASALDENPTVDLVYADYYMTLVPNVFFENAKRYGVTVNRAKEFSCKAMRGCLPGAQPMWRKSMHEKCGYFDETFLIEGDYEMWLRAVFHGGSCFKHVKKILGLVLRNESGLSLNPAGEMLRKREHERIHDAFKKHITIY